MVTKFQLESVLDGPPPEDFDDRGRGHVRLVSLNKREGKQDGEQLVGLSYLVPRIYILLGGIGWWNIATRRRTDIARP
jgi:hypothetical protein